MSQNFDIETYLNKFTSLFSVLNVEKPRKTMI